MVAVARDNRTQMRVPDSQAYKQVGGVYLFSLAGVPVSVSGWYFVLIGYYAYSAGAAAGLLFGLCVTVSLLVHEFGHALVARRYNLSPAVLLHGLGGLCGHRKAAKDSHDAFIVAAGPAAGLALGGLTYAVFKGMWAYRPDLMYGSVPLQLTFLNLLYINFVWSLANLLPLWPLDGGQLFRLLMQKLLSPAKAARATHITSIVVGITALVLVALYVQGPFVMLIVGFLVYQNFSALATVTQVGDLRSANKQSKELLAEAEAALMTGRPEEAIRLCQQLRSSSFVAESLSNKVWAILAVSSYAMGNAEDADDYAKHAPDKVVLAMLERLPKDE